MLSGEVRIVTGLISLIPDSCMFAHRRVACTAKLGCGSAHGNDVTDEIEEDREDRVEVSEIMDSGDEAEDAERARDDLRVGMDEFLLRKTELGGPATDGQGSKVLLARQVR